MQISGYFEVCVCKGEKIEYVILNLPFFSSIKAILSFFVLLFATIVCDK